MKHTPNPILLAACVCMLLLSSSPAAAQSVPPRDPSFGNNGAALLNLYDSLAGFGFINDYVIDGLGNAYFLVPRTYYNVNAITDYDGIIVKINAAGKLDSSFNGMGYCVIHNMTLTTIWPQPYRWPNFLRISNDNSTITAYTQSADTIHTYRVTNTGLPDYTYGDKGCKNIGVAPNTGVLQDVRLTTDGGALLYSGYTAGQDSIRLSVIKLDAESNLDPSFNGSGTNSIELLGMVNSPFYLGCIPLASGGFLMETSSEINAAYQLGYLNFVKFTAGGAIDSSYGVNGAASILVSNYPLFPYQTISAHSVMLADSSVVAMLLSASYYTNTLIQFKVTPGGIIDSTFGANGMNVTSYGVGDNFIGRYTDPGSLYFWTNRSKTDSAGIVSMRLKPNGYLDSTFSQTALLTGPFFSGGYTNPFDQYAWVSGQQITGATTYKISGSPPNNDDVLSIARLDQNAAAVTAYGAAGKSSFTSGLSNDQLLNLQPLSDGRMVGVATDGVQERLCRVTRNGLLDKSFNNGTGLVNLDLTHFQPNNVLDLLVDASNRVIVVAPNYLVNVYNELTVARYSVDGQLDAGFGKGGYVSIQSQINTFEAISYVKSAIQSDGKVLLLYRDADAFPQTSKMGILRLNTDGTIDNTFGSNGWVYYNNGFDFPETLTVLHDGNILAAGTSQDGGPQYLVKFSPTGQLLTIDGSYTSPSTVYGNSGDNLFYLGEADSGKIVYALTGNSILQDTYTFVGRLNADLSYDLTTGNTYYWGDQLSSAQTLHDGRVVLTGLHNTANTPSHLAMTITKSDLSIDSSLGQNGFLTFTDLLPDTLTQTNPYAAFASPNYYNQSFAYNAIVCFHDANGQIVTAATAKKDSMGDLFLMRHLFNDTAVTYATRPPSTAGNLVVWTHALCPTQGFINFYLYDSSGKMVEPPGGVPNDVLTALPAAPACGGNGGVTYTAPPGAYTLKAFCGKDSLISAIRIGPDSCTAKDVAFGDTTTVKPPPPNDTTSTTPPPTPPTDSTNTVIVSPNPTTGMLYIHLPGPDQGNIIIADMAGRVVRQVAFNGQEVQLDLSPLGKGYYMVSVKGRQYTRTLTVLKL